MRAFLFLEKNILYLREKKRRTIMTARQAMLTEKLNDAIPYLSEQQLYIVFTIVEAFRSTQQTEKNIVKEKLTLPPKNPRFGGRRISDEVAEIFLTGNSLDVSDEELEQMKYDYLTAKYQ